MQLGVPGPPPTKTRKRDNVAVGTEGVNEHLLSTSMPSTNLRGGHFPEALAGLPATATMAEAGSVKVDSAAGGAVVLGEGRAMSRGRAGGTPRHDSKELRGSAW